MAQSAKSGYRPRLDSRVPIAQRRPAVDVEKLGNGDVRLASEARDLGLVDGMLTADDYL